MRYRHCTIVALALAMAPVGAAQTCPAGAPVAFVDVAILTMDSAALGPRSTVLVRDGRIEAINPAAVTSGYCRIEGAGRVLMPGLADMHVHTAEREMALFLANGVTLIREMNGSPSLLTLRDRIARGEVIGPRMLLASTLLAGVPFENVRYRLISSPPEAGAAARDAKAAGYDFLKIYDGLSREAWDTLVQAGRALGLPLDGHIPADVGLAAVLETGQAIQHMDKIAVALAGHAMDTSRLADARRLFADRRAWVTPTLASLLALDRARTEAYAEALLKPEMKYVDAASMGWWRSLTGTRPRRSPSRFYQYQTALLGVLRETDARFLLGTDAANPLMVAGFSVHEELDVLVRDGRFSPFEALRTATVNVGAFLGEPLTGRLAVGAPASLLLANSNPLADLTVLRVPAGVMVNGLWLSRSALDSMLAAAQRP